MIYLLISEPSLLLKSKLNELIHQSVKEVDDFNCVYLDFENHSLDIIIEQLQTPSFTSDKKVIIVKNPYFFTEEKKKLPFDNNLNLLEEYIKNPNENSDLIIICSKQYYKPKNKYYAFIQKHSKVEDLLIEDKNDLRHYAQTLINKLNLKFEPSALNLLLNRCQNVTILEKELTKLSLYNQYLDEESVDLLVPRPLEENVFDLSNALLKKQKQKVMQIYNDLKKLKTEPIQLIGLLANQFRFLLQVGILKNNKKSDEEIASLLNAHPYRVKIAKENLRQYSLKNIKNILLSLADLDYSIKKGTKDRYVDFEIFLMSD